MQRKWQNGVYISMMVDSLRRKEKILLDLRDSTKVQEEMLKSEEMDVDSFLQSLDQKGELIDQLNQVDEGFDTLFKLVSRELEEHRPDYREEIREMQEKIRHISELGVQIQAMERQNSGRLKAFLSRKRSRIRDVRLRGKTASSYYDNMNKTSAEQQSYFLNEMK